MNEDDMPPLWENPIQPITIVQPLISPPTEEGVQSIDVEKPDEEKFGAEIEEQIQGEPMEEEQEQELQKEESEEVYALKYFIQGPWMNPSNVE